MHPVAVLSCQAYKKHHKLCFLLIDNLWWPATHGTWLFLLGYYVDPSSTSPYMTISVAAAIDLIVISVDLFSADLIADNRCVLNNNVYFIFWLASITFYLMAVIFSHFIIKFVLP